jgi:hypothetical protein
LVITLFFNISCATTQKSNALRPNVIKFNTFLKDPGFHGKRVIKARKTYNYKKNYRSKNFTFLKDEGYLYDRKMNARSNYNFKKY